MPPSIKAVEEVDGQTDKQREAQRGERYEKDGPMVHQSASSQPAAGMIPTAGAGGESGDTQSRDRA